MNVSLDHMTEINKVEDVAGQTLYIVDENNRQIYSQAQSQLFAPFSQNPYARYVISGLHNQKNIFFRDGKPYALIQIRSGQNPWKYVLVTNLLTYSQQMSNIRLIITSVIGGFLLIGVVLAMLFSVHFFKPVQDLATLFDHPDLANFSSKSDSEIKQLAERIVSSIQVNHRLSDELNERLAMLNQSRLLALQTQINPHFLFNTLNLINMMEIDALGFDHPIPKLTLKASKLLRYAIEGTDLVSLKTELAYTNIFLDILNKRYGDTIEVKIAVSEDVYDTQVPKLLMQPLIENAIFHGLTHGKESGCVTLSCHRQETMCVLLVRDNGKGMNQEMVNLLNDEINSPDIPTHHIGLRNTIMRLHLLFGDKCSLVVTSQLEIGTEIMLEFPYLSTDDTIHSSNG